MRSGIPIVLRASGWLGTEYNNQSDPGSFLFSRSSWFPNLPIQTRMLILSLTRIKLIVEDWRGDNPMLLISTAWISMMPLPTQV